MTPSSLTARALWQGHSDLGRYGPTVLGARNERWCRGGQDWRRLHAVLVSTKSPISLAPSCRASYPCQQAGAAVRALPSPGVPHCISQIFLGVKSWYYVQYGRVDTGAHCGLGAWRSCTGPGGGGGAAPRSSGPSPHAAWCGLR